MAHICGVGAVMIYSHDPKSLADWYESLLDISMSYHQAGRYYYGMMRDPALETETPFGILTALEKPQPGRRTTMVNYRVDHFDEFLEQLRKKNVPIEDIIQDEYGRFAHIVDPEGNPIEIWEPPAKNGSPVGS